MGTKDTGTGGGTSPTYVCLTSPMDCIERHFTDAAQALAYLSNPFGELTEEFTIHVDLRNPDEITLTYLPEQRDG